MAKKFFIVSLFVISATAWGADKMVVGYYPSWMSGTFPHTVIPWQYLTHIAHAFIGPQADGQLDVPSGFLYPQLVTAAHANGVKVVVSVGGWNTTYDDNFTALAADSTARRAFADNVKQFCVVNGYDGADIDWEYPGSPTDRTNHALMIHALRQAFDSVVPRLTLSMAGPATNWSGQWFDFEATRNDFDWIGIMTYDFYGNWSAVAGPNAPLYGSTPPNDLGWADFSLSYYRNTRGVAVGKLLIGVPFYGWTFNAAAMYGTSTGNPKAIQEQYAVIAPRLAQGWMRTWDAAGQVPYMQDAAHTKVTSYDDSESVALKAEFAQAKETAGVIIWALGEDLINGRPVLLEAVGKALRPVTGIAEEPAAPLRFALDQNYPNPFNPTTRIRYTVGRVVVPSGALLSGVEGPASSKVSLILYDLLGREVAVLVNERKPAGSYEISFDANGLASGVYIYRLTARPTDGGQAGAFTQSRTMVLVK